MKLKHAAVLMSVAVLAACGGGKQEGDVRFLGFTPVTANQKDNRSVQVFCPNCHEAIEIDKARCENKKCKADLKWSAEYRCPSCHGSGVCAACSILEQGGGDCYNCKGQGVLIYAGKSPTCPNCKGSKQCPTCKGSKKCDFCGGEGKLAKEVVKTKAAKFVNKDEGLPESDARPPVKPEEKKDMPKDEKKEEPKEEPKKEEKKEEK